MTTPVDTRLLAIYLDDHVAGATVGVQRVRRMAKVYDGTVVGHAIAPLVRQLEDAPRGYDLFQKKEDGCIKVVLDPTVRTASAPDAPDDAGSR